jgi:hypothetical protein
VLGDQACVVEGQHVDLPGGGGPVGGGYAVEGPVVSAGHHADADDLVAFCHHRLQVEAHVRASCPEPAEDLPGTFGSVGGAGPRVVVDEARREEAADLA